MFAQLAAATLFALVVGPVPVGRLVMTALVVNLPWPRLLVSLESDPAVLDLSAPCELRDLCLLNVADRVGETFSVL